MGNPPHLPTGEPSGMSKMAEHPLFKPYATQNGTLRISAWDALHLTARYGASHPETRSRLARAITCDLHRPIFGAMAWNAKRHGY